MSGVIETTMDRALAAKARRTISVHHDEDDAKKAARDMVHLWNGVPCGHSLFLWTKLGKVALCTVNHWKLKDARKESAS